MRLTEAEFARHCSYVAHLASAWAADTLMLPERLNEPVNAANVARFTDDIRSRLDRIDRLARLALQDGGKADG